MNLMLGIKAGMATYTLLTLALVFSSASMGGKASKPFGQFAAEFQVKQAIAVAAAFAVGIGVTYATRKPKLPPPHRGPSRADLPPGGVGLDVPPGGPELGTARFPSEGKPDGAGRPLTAVVPPRKADPLVPPAVYAAGFVALLVLLVFAAAGGVKDVQKRWGKVSSSSPGGGWWPAPTPAPSPGYRPSSSPGSGGGGRPTFSR